MVFRQLSDRRVASVSVPAREQGAPVELEGGAKRGRVGHIGFVQEYRIRVFLFAPASAKEGHRGASKALER
jgi:hypothetical protein